jgi:hypothetical protein
MESQCVNDGEFGLIAPAVLANCHVAAARFEFVLLARSNPGAKHTHDHDSPQSTRKSLAFGASSCKHGNTLRRAGRSRALAKDPTADGHRADTRRTIDHANPQPFPVQPGIEAVGITGHLDPLDTAGTA